MHAAASALKRSSNHNDPNDYTPLTLPTPQRVELQGIIESNNYCSCSMHPVCEMQVKVSDVFYVCNIWV